jgi:hypothetical protein
VTGPTLALLGLGIMAAVGFGSPILGLAGTSGGSRAAVNHTLNVYLSATVPQRDLSRSRLGSLKGWLGQVDGLKRSSSLACSDPEVSGIIPADAEVGMLEVTITHNLHDAGEVSQLFVRRLIREHTATRGPR